MSSRRLTHFILLALVLGAVAGYVINVQVPADAKLWAERFSLFTDLFLRLIKMVIAPLVISTLVVGIAKMGDLAAVGRIGLKTMGWFLAASAISLTLGIVLVNLFEPGAGLHLALPPGDLKTGLAVADLSFHNFVLHAVPTSVVEAMAQNEILQIVVFSVLFGAAAAALGDYANPLIKSLDVVGHVMLKVTSFVMVVAPLAVFSAVAAAIAENGISIILVYGRFMLSFYGALIILWCILIAAGFAVFGRRAFALLGHLKEPLLLAYATASSESAYPKLLEQLERFGVPNRIASFVLPIGYSFNLDGSMLYTSFATIFIAEAYGVHLSFAQQATLMAVLMLTSKGMAGVPRASLVVVAAALPLFGVPADGIVLLLAVDHFLDMARSATNIVGNAVASCAVARFEGLFPAGGGVAHAEPDRAAG